MPPVSATRSFVTSLSQSRGDLRLTVRGWSNPLLHERVPFVAMRALPEELRAAIPAPDAHVGIEIEHGLSRDVDVFRDQMAWQIERRQGIPDGLMDGQGMRIMLERLEQERE